MRKIAFSVLILLTVLILPVPATQSNLNLKVVYIEAFQFGYRVVAIQEGNRLIEYPEGTSTLKLNVGDRVLFYVITRDVTHGFYIEGYTQQASERKIKVLPGKLLWVGPVTFDKVGKFRIRCSVTCGPLHPFMTMDVIVEPNVPYHAFNAAVLFSGMVTVAYLRKKPSLRFNREIDLLRVKFLGRFLKKLVKSRGVHFALVLINLFFFTLIIVAGFFGNPTGSRNFSITVTWILWFSLVEFMILFAGRLWCYACPIPVFGEWIARRSIVTVGKKPRDGKFPKKYRNMWIPAAGFFVLSLFLPLLVTRPLITAFLFLTLLIAGTYFYLIHPPRYFCKHICPASGYIGYHSNASILAVRCRDRDVCRSHKDKKCINGYGCLWKLYPGGNSENTYCGMCFECLRSCSLDNMTIKIRMIGNDLPKIAAKAEKRLDEIWMGFIRFSLAIFYELVFFGSIYWLKDWGNMGNRYAANLETAYLLIPSPVGILKWINWAIIVSAVTLILIPAVFYVFSWTAARVSGVSERKMFSALSYSLAPYGLFIWIGFAISLLGAFWSYVVEAFADPFGYGIKLINLESSWEPLDPYLILLLQSPFIIAGLVLAIVTTYRIAHQLVGEKAVRITAVMSVLHISFALLLVRIIAG